MALIFWHYIWVCLHCYGEKSTFLETFFFSICHSAVHRNSSLSRSSLESHVHSPFHIRYIIYFKIFSLHIIFPIHMTYSWLESGSAEWVWGLFPIIYSLDFYWPVKFWCWKWLFSIRECYDFFFLRHLIERRFHDWCKCVSQ